MPTPKQVATLFNEVITCRSFEAVVKAVTPLMEDELRRLIRREMARDGDEIVFHPTVLVTEAAYSFHPPLSGNYYQRVDFREYVLAVAALTVRRILVELARMRLAPQPADGREHVDADATRISSTWSADLIALDEALATLAAREREQGQVAEFRIFGGLTVEDICDVMQIAQANIKRDWHHAKVQLSSELERYRQWSGGTA